MICPFCAAELPIEAAECPVCQAALAEYVEAASRADRLFNEGLALLEQDRYDDAAVALCRAAGLRPLDDEITVLWASALSQGGHPDAALRVLEGALTTGDTFRLRRARDTLVAAMAVSEDEVATDDGTTAAAPDDGAKPAAPENAANPDAPATGRSRRIRMTRQSR